MESIREVLWENVAGADGWERKAGKSPLREVAFVRLGVSGRGQVKTVGLRTEGTAMSKASNVSQPSGSKKLRWPVGQEPSR